MELIVGGQHGCCSKSRVYYAGEWNSLVDRGGLLYLGENMYTRTLDIYPRALRAGGVLQAGGNV